MFKSVSTFCKCISWHSNRTAKFCVLCLHTHTQKKGRNCLYPFVRCLFSSPSVNHNTAVQRSHFSTGLNFFFFSNIYCIYIQRFFLLFCFKGRQLTNMRKKQIIQGDCFLKLLNFHILPGQFQILIRLYKLHTSGNGWTSFLKVLLQCFVNCFSYCEFSYCCSCDSFHILS